LRCQWKRGKSKSMRSYSRDEYVSIDQEIREQVARVIAKGSMLVMISLFMAAALKLVFRLIITRSLSPSEYGIFSLGYAIVLIVVPIFGLGLDQGAQRFIALYRGQGDLKRVKGTVLTAASISMFASAIALILFILATKSISSFLDKPQLFRVLLIMAFVIPVIIIIKLIVAVYQGFEFVYPKVVFYDISLNVVIVCGAIVVSLLRPTLYAFVVSFVLAYLLIMAALGGYVLRKPLVVLKGIKIKQEISQLLAYSLPLGIALSASLIMINVDTLCIGYYRTASEVGLYNVAVPMYQLIGVFLVAMAFIYGPVAARLVGERKHGELYSLYSSVTKWLFILTMPLCFICILYPHETIRLLFGARYTSVAPALRLLALGEFIHTILGPNGVTLVAIGRSNLFLVDNVTALIINIFLNILFIPRYGVIGAALATTTTIALWNAAYSIQLYYLYRIHPFHKKFIMPVVFSVVALLALYLPLKAVLQKTLLILPFYYFIFLAISLVSVPITRSTDEADRFVIDFIKEFLYKTLKKAV